jgi:hypothetical protein
MAPKNDAEQSRDKPLDAKGTSSASSNVSSPADRRGEIRVPHKAVLIMPFGEGIQARFERAKLVDCSAHGVGLIVRRPLKPGVFLFLKLKITTVALVMYKVKHCRPEDEGFRVGAEFHGVIGNNTDREATAETVFNALLAT